MQGTPERLAPGSAEEEAHAPWVWVGAEAVVIRGMLRALHGHCITELPRGWTALERTACHLRHVHSMLALFQFSWSMSDSPRCHGSAEPSAEHLHCWPCVLPVLCSSYNAFCLAVIACKILQCLLQGVDMYETTQRLQWQHDE